MNTQRESQGAVMALPFLPDYTGEDERSLFCSAPRYKTSDWYCYYNKRGLVAFSLGRSSEFFRATSYVIAIDIHGGRDE